MTDDDVVRAYWEHYAALESGNSGEEEWAWDEVNARVEAAPADAVALLVDLAGAAPDDAALAYLGAGPVEDLVVCHGSQVIFDQVEGAARRNESFRKALRCAWYDERIPSEVSARLRRLGDLTEQAPRCCSAKSWTAERPPYRAGCPGHSAGYRALHAPQEVGTKSARPACSNFQWPRVELRSSAARSVRPFRRASRGTAPA